MKKRSFRRIQACISLVAALCCILFFALGCSEKFPPKQTKEKTREAPPHKSPPKVSKLKDIAITKEMPRGKLEKLVEEATGQRSTYNIYSMHAQTEATYHDALYQLNVTFNRGYPHSRGTPNHPSIPAIDATVVSWKFKRK